MTKREIKLVADISKLVDELLLEMMILWSQGKELNPDVVVPRRRDQLLKIKIKIQDLLQRS
jgi:hypothetical protein